MRSMSVLRRLARAALALLASFALSAAAQAPANAPAPAAAPPTPAVPAAPTFALLLPGPNTPFGSVADAVRKGFLAAHKLSASPATVQVVDLDDGADLRAALEAAASRGATLAVGPLRRALVNAVVDGGLTGLPMVLLNQPDSDAGAPATAIALGLSLEAEAQRIAKAALASYVPVATAPLADRVLVVAGNEPLQRRVAQAFVQALREAGERPVVIEPDFAALEPYAQQMARGRYEAVFLALDARQAALIRARLPRVPMFGTSLLNVGNPAASAEAMALAIDLEGVRFVDAPWLLEPEHPAVALYERPQPPQPPELARLYALGIDAYRVATLWQAGITRFDIDGATGRLQADRARSVRIERTPPLAVYRGGSIVRDGN